MNAIPLLLKIPRVRTTNRKVRNHGNAMTSLRHFRYRIAAIAKVASTPDAP
jgi:hypothetical protein